MTRSKKTTFSNYFMRSGESSASLVHVDASPASVDASPASSNASPASSDASPVPVDSPHLPGSPGKASRKRSRSSERPSSPITEERSSVPSDLLRRIKELRAELKSDAKLLANSMRSTCAKIEASQKLDTRMEKLFEEGLEAGRREGKKLGYERGYRDGYVGFLDSSDMVNFVDRYQELVFERLWDSTLFLEMAGRLSHNVVEDAIAFCQSKVDDEAPDSGVNFDTEAVVDFLKGRVQGWNGDPSQPVEEEWWKPIFARVRRSTHPQNLLRSDILSSAPPEFGGPSSVAGAGST
ncbi:hypothetical protein CASFOL_033567 [Castilleja foliolosa]|uniref:Uncharacterized protein n=1 Tax=Castilleja foliolosa TaxID=1961234 RepID=A0ABD3BYH1_9LAMI